MLSLFRKTTNHCCTEPFYGEVKNGYQYCQKCGRAVAAPSLPRTDTTCCTQHKWKILHELSITANLSGTVQAIKYIGQCEHCGIIHVDVVSVKH